MGKSWHVVAPTKQIVVDAAIYISVDFKHERDHNGAH